MVGRPRVVIVGAGFAGLDCATRLAGEPVAVTLVDRHNFHTFQPLLYQVATAGLAAADVGHPVRGIFQDAPNVAVRTAEVIGVDWTERTVAVAEGAAIPFDHLVLAAGATTNWFDVAGAEGNALPLYGLGDAIRVRNHVLAQFEAADADPSLVEAGALTFVVVGGGPTGVEMVGALTELFDTVLAKDFRHLDMSATRVVLVEMGDAVLRPFAPRLQRYAADQLGRRGVELRLGATVAEVAADHVVLADGEVLATRTLIWAAGVRANRLAGVVGLEQGPGGRILVGPDLRVAGRPEVSVVGDLAAVSGPRGDPLPQLAPVAKQSGRFVGERIAREVHGRSSGAFRYVDRGTMATIGRGAAVAQLPLGITLTGVPAWMAWLLLHLVFLVGFRNRVSVFTSWAWNYLTYDRTPRLIIDPARSEPKPGHRPDEGPRPIPPGR